MEATEFFRRFYTLCHAADISPPVSLAFDAVSFEKLRSALRAENRIAYRGDRFEECAEDCFQMLGINIWRTD